MKPKVVVACPGIGHAMRGFETLASECFDALRREGSLDVTLVRGSGQAGSGELVARTVRRDSAVARVAARALRRGPYGPYEVEQLGFVARMAPQLAALRPDVVFLSDLLASRALAGWRRLARSGFKLVVSNGGPWPPELLGHADHVQELTPAAHEHALASGASEERHTLLPLGVDMSPRFEATSVAERARRRDALGLPERRRILLSVGALTFRDKRLDYLIREMASLAPPRPFLVLLGAQEGETRAVRALAGKLLEPSDYTIRTAGREQMGDYYRAADLFALASLVEAFGRVMVEAMAHGLPCVAHDGPVQRYLLGPHGQLGDLRAPGELARLVGDAMARDFGPGAAMERHRFVHERFSWDVLAQPYASLLGRCAAQP